MQTKTILATAVAATLGGVGAADATTYTATLLEDLSYSGNGQSIGKLTSSTANWSYDDVTNLLTQGDYVTVGTTTTFVPGGTSVFNVRFTIVPTTTLFRHSITGLVIGNGAAAGGTTYACTEGTFGPGVGASLCGNYNFGANFTNESTSSWGPGTAFARSVLGDDMSVGAQQSLAAYDGFATTRFFELPLGDPPVVCNATSTTCELVLTNAVCNPLAPGNANGCATNANFNQGYRWTLEASPPQQTVVPAPAAVWLLGTGLVALGARRLRAKKA